MSISIRENSNRPQAISKTPVEMTFGLPNLSANLSLFVAAGNSATGSGRAFNAAVKGYISLTNWKCSICMNMNDNITNIVNEIAINPIVNLFPLKNSNGKSGCSILFSQ